MLKEERKLNKRLMFVFSMISLLGLIYGLIYEDIHNGVFYFTTFVKIWLVCSIPLIIQIIYNLIFRD